MEDLDYNYQNQPNFTLGVADRTVAQLTDAENIADRERNNRLHTMNCRDWTDEEKKRVVEIDREERMKGKNFMRRIAQRWRQEYEKKQRTAQNLIDSAKRFAKEGWGRVQEDPVNSETQERDTQSRTVEWTTEMKVRLVQIDDEERKRGRGFIKRVKERWADEYPEHARASIQKLRDNAARFRKEQTITNLILVRQRNEVENENRGNQRDDQQEIISNEVNQDESNIEHETTVEGPELIDEELEAIFDDQLTNLKHVTMTDIEPREKLRKLKMPAELQERANSTLRKYLRGVDTIPEITDKVYAMGKAVEIKISLPQKVSRGNRRQKPSNGNRRVRKMKREMKMLRRSIARAGNKLHRRKQKRKATNKENKILKDLKHQMEESETTSMNIRRYKEKWVDQLRYKRVKLEKMIERGNRIKDNVNFEKDQKTFFRP